jgi:hypothetical protein
MNDKTDTTLSEDAVIEAVFEGDEEDLLNILREQPSYSDFAQDIQSVKQGLKSLEGEEPPAFLIKNFISKNSRPLFSKLQDLPFEWYKNPYLLSFGCVMAIIFFYLFLMFFLK